MPIWFEVTVLMLTAYGLGVAAGWTLWNRPEESDDEHTAGDDA